MSRPVKKPLEGREIGDLVVVYTRIPRADLEDLQRREKVTGATVAAQIRILIRDGLRGRGFVK